MHMCAHIHAVWCECATCCTLSLDCRGTLRMCSLCFIAMGCTTTPSYTPSASCTHHHHTSYAHSHHAHITIIHHQPARTEFLRIRTYLRLDLHIELLQRCSVRKRLRHADTNTQRCSMRVVAYVSVRWYVCYSGRDGQIAAVFGLQRAR